MIKNPLNILIIASWYPSENDPMSGSFIQEQALMLKEYGHNVTVLHVQLKGTFIRTIFNRKTVTKISFEKGIKTIYLHVSPVLPGIRGLAYNKCYKQALKIIETEIKRGAKFDLIHSHSMFLGGYIAMRLSEVIKLPFYHTEHSSRLIFDSESYNQTDKRIIIKVFNSAKHVFFVSEFAKNQTLSRWNVPSSEKFAVLPNIVDESFFQNPIVTPDVIPFKYLIIASLIPVKNVATLIRAWEILIQEYPNSILSIAGQGYLKNELQLLVKSLNLDKTVHFIPRLSRDEVRLHLSKNNVLVSSSKIETFGLTVAEAQASGKPVIVTDSGGVRDIVTESTGIITDLRPDQLAKGLIEIQRNYNKYDSNIIRETASKKFSSEIIYNYLEKIYFQMQNS